MNHRALALVVLPLVAGACSAPGDTWRGTIEEREGVLYVSNPRDGVWQDRDPEPIRFELEQTFGVDSEPAEAILNRIGRQAFDVDDAGNVYIFDGGDDRLVSFAPDGSLRWSGGRPGQGPGEFSGAEGMAWNGASKIYVTTARGARIDSWSTDGEFLDSRSIAHLGPGSGSLVGVLDEHTVVLQEGSTFPAGVRIAVIYLEGDGSTVADFDVDVTSGPTESGAIMEVEIVDGSIAIGDWDSYELRFYSREGALERVVTRDSEHMVLPATREEQQSRIYATSWLKPPILLAGGLMVATTNWTDAEALADLRTLPETPSFEQWRTTMRGSFDFFDRDGRYLVSVLQESVDIGNVDEVDAEGRVYTVMMDPYPHIRRYRVEIDGR